MGGKGKQYFPEKERRKKKVELFMSAMKKSIKKRKF